jgi:SHS family lactate transporter-like MFS transporter
MNLRDSPPAAMMPPARMNPPNLPNLARIPDHPVPFREAALATIAGFLGWTLDAFDFFLVVISLPRIAAEFQSPESKIALSLTLTLAFRPVGALIFGLLADRYGRRIPMIANLIFYSAVEVATGFAHNLTTFLILRALFGIGMGGEWGVGASLVMEKVSPRWRGLLSGTLQEGYAAGSLLSAVAAYFLLDRTWLRGFDPNGWRLMFFIGGAPALLALFIRFFVKESEVWLKTKAESWSHLGSTIVSHWKIWLYLTLLMAMMNMSSHGTQDMFPTFMKSFRHMEPRAYSKIVSIGSTGAIFGGVLFGLASDKLGRRRMMILAFIGALAAVYPWATSSGLHAITLSAFMMQFMVQGAWGIIPAHINELAPDRVRGFLPGFAYQCGNLIASPIAWLQAKLVEVPPGEPQPYPKVMGISAACIFLLAIVATVFGREKRGIRFGIVDPRRCTCGYDLSGLNGGLCPECGRRVPASPDSPPGPSRS